MPGMPLDGRLAGLLNLLPAHVCGEHASIPADHDQAPGSPELPEPADHGQAGEPPRKRKKRDS